MLKTSLELIREIKNGAVGVMPTDTIYGLVGSALLPKTVRKIYRLKNRPTNLPFIILISGWSDLKKLKIDLSRADKKILNLLWPEKISVILPSLDNKYLHRGTKSIAVRWPANKELVDLIRKTGPLIATSANIHNQTVANNIRQAIHYFDNKIDFYIPAGEIKDKPSTLISLLDGKISLVRQGSKKIPTKFFKLN